MLQKCTILGLVFLLAGGGAFGWLYREAQRQQQQAQDLVPASSLGPQEYVEKYGRWYQLSPEQQNQLLLEINKERGSKSATQLAREQQARLHGDLDKLAAGQMNPGDIADFLYGPGWQSQVEEYKQRNEQTETAQTVAMVCLSIGGVLFTGCMIFWLVRFAAWVIRAWRHRSDETPEEPETQAADLTDLEQSEAEITASPEVPEPEPEPQPRQRRKLALSEASAESGSESSGRIEGVFSAPTVSALAASHPTWGAPNAGEAASVAVLLADERAPQEGWSAQAQWSSCGAGESPAASGQGQQRPAMQATLAENPLKGQADDLQRQIAEFKQVAQSVQQATREQSEPLGSTLKELAQQVSAIREYAASQQDRVEKLQDGYDWGIIRTFCLRVIRVLDNLEGRLVELPKEDSSVNHLEEVRDELLFALESSGVEQFQPEVNSEFRGQERFAEALKEKQPAKKPGQAGKIAKVLRPGYRYMVDDDNYRIVRTAQVKLYG